jgi:hypothetical protein
VRSYQIWEREGRPDGRHLDHWMQAMAELRAEAVAPAPQKPATAPKPRAPRSKKS